jgi:hypothetical protein
MKMKMKEEAYVVSEIIKKNTNNQFRFSEIIFCFVIIIEEQGYSKRK